MSSPTPQAVRIFLIQNKQPKGETAFFVEYCCPRVGGLRHYNRVGTAKAEGFQVSGSVASLVLMSFSERQMSTMAVTRHLSLSLEWKRGNMKLLAEGVVWGTSLSYVCGQM